MSYSRSAVVVIQSRLASTRLPAKALLPIAGVPSVALCALRAGNTGLRVIVATSDTPTDDAVADVLTAAAVGCFRGPHHDVLSRYAQATRDLPESAVIVRLTADNVLPDGEFVQMLLDEFGRKGGDYLGTGSPQDGLPYGMSAEVFTAAALRRADGEAYGVFDREHVTPWIRRMCNASRYVFWERREHWPRLRCTLDTFEDYAALLRVFAGCTDPVKASWTELVERLASISLGGDEPRCPYIERSDGSVHSVLTLGTAQLGSSYGIANRAGTLGDCAVGEILAQVADAGITSIDTASAYGSSEVRIGALLPANAHDRIRVITKLDVLTDVPRETPGHVVAKAVDASVFRSLHRLRRRQIDTLLLHRWSHHGGWSGAVWNRLLELKSAGIINTLGASVSSPAEAQAALADPDIGHLQCPVNLLDARWRDSSFLEALRARSDVVIHARSVLLQGMLTLPAEAWVPVQGVQPQQLCDALDELVKSFGRADRVDLCMAYVRTLPWVTSLVVGMESLEQLQRNLRRARAPALSPAQMETVSGAFPALPEALVNPAMWSTTRG